MTIGELKKIISKIDNNAEIYFDSEAMCFDVHYIKINDAVYDFMDGQKWLVLNYDRSQIFPRFKNK